MTAAPPADALAYVRDMMARSPVHQWLKPLATAVDPERGTITVKLPFRPDLARTAGQIDHHGGVIAALIDIAGYACLQARLRQPVPTIDLHVNYLRMAKDTDLTAHAEIVRAGRTTGVVDIKVVDDRGQSVALGRGVFSTARPA